MADDVVVMLDRWMAALHEAHPDYAGLQRARDEIVALREQLGAVRGIAGHERKLSEAIIQQARAEALEEAARLCDRIGLDGFASDGAAAIRALKDEGRDPS